MADDLDWDAIIAPGNEAGDTADRRSRSTDDRADTDGAGAPARPRSRREARQARAAEESAAPTAGEPVGTAHGDVLPDPAPVRSTTDADAEAAALLGGSAPASRPADADADADTDTDTATRTGAGSRRGTWQAAAATQTTAGDATGGTHHTGDAGRTDTLDRAEDTDPVGDADRLRAAVAASGSRPHGNGPSGGGPQDGGAGGGRGGGDGRGGRGGASRPPRGDRPARRKGPLIAGIVIVALVLAAGVGAAAFVVPKVQQVVGAFSGSKEPDDYTGSGTSKVTVTIKNGDIGEDVAKTLQRSGVVKSSSVFYQLLLETPSVQFQPGSYALKKQMSAKAALAALQDKANRVDASIVIPEGTALKDIEAGMVSKTGLSKADVEAAAKDVSAYGLPSGVTTLEGWLFPATYPINPGWTAKQYFQSMVDTMKQHLKAAGVADADQEHVIVFASLVQKEAGLAADYPKVARVFQNRLDQGMPLQSDATVAYGTGNTHRVTTTDAERADAGNPYNTYQHQGLPPAPISNPGDLAINAVTKPASGKWLYFVTVDLETGETVFSDTYAEHQQAVAQFQAWLRAHPSYQ